MKLNFMPVSFIVKDDMDIIHGRYGKINNAIKQLRRRVPMNSEGVVVYDFSISVKKLFCYPTILFKAGYSNRVMGRYPIKYLERR